MQLRNPLCFFVGLNQDLFWKTDHFCDIIGKTFLCDSVLDLVKKVEFLFNFVIVSIGFLCQLIGHLGTLNLLMWKEVSGDGRVMSAEKSITANIFQNKIYCSLGYSHSVISGSSPAEFVYNDQGWWCGLLQNTIGFLKLNIKGRFTWITNHLPSIIRSEDPILQNIWSKTIDW